MYYLRLKGKITQKMGIPLKIKIAKIFSFWTVLGLKSNHASLREFHLKISKSHSKIRATFNLKKNKFFVLPYCNLVQLS